MLRRGRSKRYTNVVPYGIKFRHGEPENKETWLYDPSKGITQEEWPKLIKAISDVMQSHTWEQNWANLSDHVKMEMSRRFLELVKGSPDWSIQKNDEFDYFMAFESAYTNMRRTEQLTQGKKIFIDKERFLELERKVELLWYAPGMPGCMEEVQAASSSFLTTSPLGGLVSE